MAKSTVQCLLLLLGCGALFLGDIPEKKIAVLYPGDADSVSYDQGKLLLVSAMKDTTAGMILSTQWEVKKLVDISSKDALENFAKVFYQLVPPRTTIEQLSYAFKYFKGFTQAETLAFAYADTVTLQMLWQKPQFAKFMKNVQSSGASDIVIDLRGWKDSLYAQVYDDPVNDTRALYKFSIQLLPGRNALYCTYEHRKAGAVSYATRFIPDTKATVDRAERFHDSKLERSCTTCHEGLPSADSGKTMKADCAVCHKAMMGSTFLHAPVEMKECESCHSWSAEKQAVVVAKAAPEVCYDCHKEKQAEVDSSKYPHPVAGECLTCHSPHGTEQKHQLKARTYDLCTSCHEDQKINHPVGRHPLQFALLKNGDEISCTSCHNPHGSAFEKMKRFPGGRMDICTQCH
jgi:predicted CXXCH cytochrome family protein